MRVGLSIERMTILAGELRIAWIALFAAVLFAGCTKPEKPNIPLAVARFETKPTEDPNGRITNFAWKMDVRNDSDEPKRINGMVIRFFDAEGFRLVECGWMGSSEVPPHSTTSITDRSMMETKQWKAIGSYKVEFR